MLDGLLKISLNFLTESYQKFDRILRSLFYIFLVEKKN